MTAGEVVIATAVGYHTAVGKSAGTAGNAAGTAGTAPPTSSGRAAGTVKFADAAHSGEIPPPATAASCGPAAGPAGGAESHPALPAPPDTGLACLAADACRAHLMTTLGHLPVGHAARGVHLFKHLDVLSARAEHGLAKKRDLVSDWMTKRQDLAWSAPEHGLFGFAVRTKAPATDDLRARIERGHAVDGRGLRRLGGAVALVLVNAAIVFGLGRLFCLRNRSAAEAAGNRRPSSALIRSP